MAEWDGPALWVHGDLHSANLIVADGSISAVIDFGDLTSGDPAVDLAVAWMLFDEADREVFRAARRAGRDPSTMPRGDAGNCGRSTSPCSTCSTPPTRRASSGWAPNSSPPSCNTRSRLR